jgi:uncharacterized ParB-like nuclease family protein
MPMTTHTHTHRPECPFCRAEWTDAMLDQFDAMTGTSSCACCAGGEVAATPLPVPVDDLSCDTCGRAIYLKPASIAG